MERLDEMLSGMDDKKKGELDKLLEAELSRPWLATVGPQLDAFLSPADLLLYGGAAGGGKTDLGCGLALTEHSRTVVFRSQANHLEGFWERLLKLCPNPSTKNANLKKLTTTDARMIECGHLDAPGSESGWQGRDHDLIFVDEAAQLNPYRVNFVLGWLRSAQGHRCRAVLASNPPIGGEGVYLLEWFAPWLDPLYPNPARPGEIRYGITIGDASQLRTLWTNGPEHIFVHPDKTWRLATPDEIAHKPALDEVAKPLSRTFIPARLDDNPYLRDTNYRAQLNSMPEPLRSQLLKGDFLSGRQDDEWQVIPSEWVRQAQERWVLPNAKRMLAMGVDVAQGGPDQTVIAPLHEGNTFGTMIARPGVETPFGPDVANLILKYRRDGAAIAIDTTGSWGGSARDHLKSHHEIRAVAVVFSGPAEGGDNETQLGYLNMRSRMYWEFRKALDPAKSKEPVALPPGDRILAQLTAARWRPRSGKIVIESKEDIRARLGSSPDEADAIVMAWLVRHNAYRAAAAAKPTARVLEDSGRYPNSLGWLG